MNKILYIFIAALLISCTKKEKPEGNLELIVNVEGLSQGKIYLLKQKDTSLIVLDSAIIKGNSNFTKYLNISEPEMMYLFLDRGQTQSIDNSLPFFAEQGKITINTTLKEFFAAAKISGSKNNDIIKKFDTINQKFIEKNLELTQIKLQSEIGKIKINTDSLQSEFDKLKIKKYRYTAHFAKTHSNYEASPYLVLKEIPDINISYLDTIYQSLSPKVATSFYGEMLKEHIEKTKK